MVWLSWIGKWMLENWLPLGIGAIVLIGYIWVANLRSTIADQEAQIKANEAEIDRITDIAVKQGAAFEFLKEEFVRYEALVTGYIEKTNQIATSYDKLRDDFEKEVPNETLDSDVDPYINSLFARLRDNRANSQR